MLLLVLWLTADALATLSTVNAGASWIVTVVVPLFSGPPALGNIGLVGPANSVQPWKIVVLIIFG